MEDNYYTILNVPENASLEEIKKSYRKLSLKYHPDKNVNDGTTVSKFHKITEAYDVLGNEEKRKEYDFMRNNPFAKMMGGLNSFPQGDPMEDLLSNMFGIPLGNMRGPNVSFGIPNIHIFKNGASVNFGTNAMQKPTPIVKTLYISIEQVLIGANVPVDIERWMIEDGNKLFEKETLYVDIPKGIDDNEIILIREKGNIVSDFCKGDVKIFIKIPKIQN